MSIATQEFHPAEGRGSLSNQVRDHLRQRILKQEWESGSKIPSEFELVNDYQVARVTIRTALRSLEAQGLIDIRHGSGAYIANFGTSIRAGLQELRSISETIKEMGHRPGMVHRKSEIRPVMAGDAEKLQIDLGENILYLERAITADGKVVAFSYDTLNITGLSQDVIKKISSGSIFKALAMVEKHPVRAMSEIHAIKSAKIGWGSGRPPAGLYLQLMQTHFLRDGTPIMTGSTYFVEGRFQFIIHRTI